MTPNTPSQAELEQINAYWRACNYLAAAMIYLRDNPLLREPLKPEHIKQRLLGHWGASPGLSFVYVHLNRLIKLYDQDAIFLAGPGHGAPGVLAPVYLEGTYSEMYPDKGESLEGLKHFCKEFSFPGGIGSHCTPELPGSIHEGGELGYSISHAFGAAYDNPNLLVTVVVGDGEAETAALATSAFGLSVVSATAGAAQASRPIHSGSGAWRSRAAGVFTNISHSPIARAREPLRRDRQSIRLTALPTGRPP